jgi:outer membrane protease
MLCGFGADTQSTNARVTIKRDTSTDISPTNGFADNNVVAGGSYYAGGGNAVLDSPNTTSQVNYQLYMQNTAGSNTARYNNGGFSSLTCFEIGA